ncbi:flagellar hook-length control protein FliK, partial [Candidatus Latescibacterota bacterium]
LSGDVQTNDAMIGEESNFESLLASLVNAAVSEGTGDGLSAESPNPFAVEGDGVPVMLKAGSVTVRPEEISVMTDVELSDGQSAAALIKIDAELVMENEGLKMSIPADVFLMEKSGETESGMTALFMLLNTDGLSPEGIETLSGLLSDSAAKNDELPVITATPETIVLPEQAFSLPDIKSNTETDAIPLVTVDPEVNDTEDDAGVLGMFVSGDTAKTVEIPESEIDVERPILVDSEKTPVVSSNANEKITRETMTGSDIIIKAEQSGNNELNKIDSSPSQPLIPPQANVLLDEINTILKNTVQNEIEIPGVGIYARNITVESGNAETDMLRLVIETSPGEPSLTIEPKTTDSLGKPIAELIKQHVQPGETIEITIVVKTETPANTKQAQISPPVTEIVEENHVPGIQNSDTGEIIETVKPVVGNSNETKIAPSVSNNQSSIPNENKIPVSANSIETLVTPETEAAAKTYIKIENYNGQNNSGTNTGDMGRVSDTAHNANVASITDVTEIPVEETTGETVKPQSTETKLTPEIGVTREYMVSRSAGNADVPVLPTGDKNVSAEIVSVAGSENKTAQAEPEIKMNFTANETPGNNSAPVNSPKDAPAEVIKSNAVTENSMGTRNSAVEANILFNRTQREISESVRINNTETAKPIIKAVNGDNAVNTETETANTVMKPETGTIDTPEFSTQSVNPDSGKAAVRDSNVTMKPQTNEITSNSELKSEPAPRVISEKIPEGTSAAFPKEGIPITAPQNKFEMVSANGNIAEEGTQAEPTAIFKTGETVEQVIKTAGEKSEVNVSSEEAIVSGYNNSAQYSATKKNLDGISDSNKNLQGEAESAESGKVTSEAVVMNAQNEFGGNQEFQNQGETSTERFAGIENLGGEEIKSTIHNGDANVLGFAAATENADIAQQANVIENTENALHTKVSGEIDDKKMLESIVRQARFMNQEQLSRADIKLDPPNLGKLRIELVTENSKITGRITVDSPEVKEIILNSISELRENLAQSGLKVDSFDVNVGHNNGSDLWERMQKFKMASNNAQNVSTLSDSSGDSGLDPFLTDRSARTISEYSESFDVVV